MVVIWLIGCLSLSNMLSRNKTSWFPQVTTAPLDHSSAMPASLLRPLGLKSSHRTYRWEELWKWVFGGAEVIRLVFIPPNLSIQESQTNFSRRAHVPPKYCLGPCFVYRITKCTRNNSNSAFWIKKFDGSISHGKLSGGKLKLGVMLCSCLHWLAVQPLFHCSILHSLQVLHARHSLVELGLID